MDQIPAEISGTNLTLLSMFNANVGGTIPPQLTQLPFLHHLNLSNNVLEGTIPPFAADFSRDTGAGNPALISLDNNFLTGTLEALALSDVKGIIISLGSNLLEGSLPSGLLMASELFLNNNMLSGSVDMPTSISSIEKLDLSLNKFEGPLPSSPGLLRLQVLNLAHNRFTGSVSSFFSVLESLEHLDLSYNPQLAGDIPSFSNDALVWLDLSHTALAGPIPASIWQARSLVHLDLSNARLTGTMPRFQASRNSLLRHFDVSSNRLAGSLDFINPKFSNLVHLDLSHNKFEGPIAESYFMLPQLEKVALSHNRLQGSLPLVSSDQLQSLSVSHCQLVGTVPSVYLPALLDLDLSDNQFSGKFPVRAPTLRNLDISGNLFSFNASQFTTWPALTSVYASSNLLYGALPYSSTSLQTIVLRSNMLNETVQFRMWGGRSDLGWDSSFTLDIRNNPFPTISNIEESGFPMSPAIEERVNYFCEHVWLQNFQYDDSLFEYQQCRCHVNSYGKPPLCWKCHTSLNCSRPELGLGIKAGEFVFPSPAFFDPLLNPTPLPTEPFYSESCEYWDSSGSNCIGARPPPTLFSSKTPILEMEALVQPQCRTGSTGRLCSRCMCEDPYLSSELCYYASAGICIRCKSVWSLQASLSLLISLCVVAIAVLSIVIFFFLNSRRKTPTRPWNELPLLKRLVARFSLLLELGLIPILVTFIQLSAELTRWDAVAYKTFAASFNGDLSGMGLICLFPHLVSPKAMLLYRLLLPFAAAAILATSIGVANLLWLFMQGRLPCGRPRRNSSKSHMLWSEESSSGLESAKSVFLSDTEEESMPLTAGFSGAGLDSHPLNSTFAMPSSGQLGEVPYPTRALLSSVMISVASFFYFSVSLTATKYFFSTTQPNTLFKYVLSEPWMLFAEASPLRKISVPFFVIFVAGLPVGYLCIVLKLRRHLYTPATMEYFGSIVARFKPAFFWWELIQSARKLLVAVFLRAFPSSSAWRSGSVLLTLGGALLAQTSLRPWKRKSENLLDTISGVLLIVNVLATPASGLNHAQELIFLVLGLDALFIVCITGLILYHTFTGTTSYQTRWVRITESLAESRVVWNDSKSSLAQLEGWQLASSTDESSHSDSASSDLGLLKEN
jgi:Leucine-rich repeat (LRR) protein